MGIEIEVGPDWDWLRLRLGKANAVGPEFLEAFSAALDQLPTPSSDSAARPLLVIGEGNAFSAGLELPALIELDRAEMTAFLGRFDRVFRRFAQLERPTIAVVNGHAVAGGAILALAADYRLAATTLASGKTYAIGLREAALGLALPAVASTIVEEAVGRAGSALEIVLSGSLYTPAEALANGMMHRLAAPEDLIPEAEKVATRFAQATGLAAALLKRRWRSAAWAEPDRSEDETWLDSWFSDEARKRVRAVVDSLKR
jgi:enoyl-CoA hydratase